MMNPDYRIGHGYDVHRLVPDRKLILGGVEIPHVTGLLGHSDADVLVHAVMDSLLGALSLGDIGHLFPDTDPAWKDADSLVLAHFVANRVLEAGWQIGNIDATVLAQEPKLAPHILKMRENIANALDIPVDRISVKATTEEGLGFTGTKQGIAAHAAPYGISVIGGDMAKLFTPGAALSLTILGKAEPDKLCLRSNAREGDWLFATGCFGNSFRSGHHLTFTPRLKEARFLAGDFVCAMQDVSDGLLNDAVRMAEASGLSLRLEPEKIPLRAGAALDSALSEGEDYELLFAVPDHVRARLEREWPFPETALTCIGKFAAGGPGTVSGLKNQPVNTGYDHFR